MKILSQLHWGGLMLPVAGIRKAGAVLMFLFAAIPAAAQDKDCRANVFVLQDLGKEPAIQSPDGRHTVIPGVKSEDDGYGRLRVLCGTKQLASFEIRDLSGGIFVAWAPDSKAFYFMWSNGGATGGYEVRVFRISDTTAVETLATKTAEQDFERRYPCPARGHNVFAVKWLEGSGQILLGLQVYPASDCGENMGRYSGYLVETGSGSLIRQYSETELKNIWPAGCPSNIWPTGLWGSDELEKARNERIPYQPAAGTFLFLIQAGKKPLKQGAVPQDLYQYLYYPFGRDQPLDKVEFPETAAERPVDFGFIPLQASIGEVP
jgi:hypothetical protein